MEKYKLIERESLSQIDKLPVVYKKLQYDMDRKIILNKEPDTMFVISTRHQTPFFGAMRFYKNIEIFAL